MFKKGLLLVIVLLVLGFVITSLVQAQTAAQQQELEQIARRSMNGLYVSATEPRMFAEQEERLQQFDQGQQQRQQLQPPQQQRQQGEITGWPASTILSGFCFSNLRQPAGTQSSYTNDNNRVISIYLIGTNANTLQDVKRQIETITRGQMDSNSSNTYFMYGGGFLVRIELEGNTLTIRLTQRAGGR